MGESCQWCDEQILPGDQGLLIPYLGETVVMQPWHVECFLRQGVGSVGHQREECSCHGGDLEDPPHMTKRQAVLAAVQEFEARNNLRRSPE